ncbi:unnamed protein product [Symbiodinium sp. CCMP2592]|nr:unnamed protein product [Symbiodinium sp. CCMP2592]
MPQQSDAKLLEELTEVPAGWSLATVIDAFVYLAAFLGYPPADRAREALSGRLVELWAVQPAEAQAWLERFGELKTATRQERLCEALLRHGAAECGKYKGGPWYFSEAGLLRGEPEDSAAERERCAAWYLQQPHTRDRCRELAERLVSAEMSLETARKRQKLEEETSERRRLEAELQKSQEEGRELRNRLAVAEAEVSSKDAELQTAQSESANCKERCEDLAARAADAETAAARMQQELGQLKEEHATTKERLSQAEADAAERRLEVQRLQEETRGCQERSQQAEVARSVLTEEPGSKAELQLEKAVLQERCDQLRQQLQQTSAKAEAERSAMLGQLSALWDERGMHKERIRELERQLHEEKKQEQESHHSNFASGTVSSEQESDLAEHFGYNLVDEDRASILSGSSQSSVKQNCFMLDAMFKVRMDVLREGRDLQKGSQVVAGDGKTLLEVVEISKEAQAGEVVDLWAGAAMLRVTPDHRVQVPDESGEAGRVYVPAGNLKAGDFVMLDAGEPVALTSAETRPMECKVLKIVFKPDLPVAVFSSPTCILSKGHKKKPTTARRGGMCQRGKEAVDPIDEGASIPDTAAGEYMD